MDYADLNVFRLQVQSAEHWQSQTGSRERAAKRDLAERRTEAEARPGKTDDILQSNIHHLGDRNNGLPLYKQTTDTTC